MECFIIPPPNPYQKGEPAIGIKDCNRTTYFKCGDDHCPSGQKGAPGTPVGGPGAKGEGPAPLKGSHPHHDSPYGTWHKGSWPHIPSPKGSWPGCQWLTGGWPIGRWPRGAWPKGSYPYNDCEPKGSSPVSTIGCPGSIIPPPPSFKVNIEDCSLPSGDPIPPPLPRRGNCCENHVLHCPK